MYLAEIHGKLSRDNENREDILTSNVFSFFKYASRKDFLYPFLQSIGVDNTPAEALEAEFQFWPTYGDRTEPDVVILVGNYYLLFEAKYHSDFGKETPRSKPQLMREIKNGDYEARTLGYEFRIFALTADYFEKPDTKKEIPAEFSSIFNWLNWQQITLFLQQILETNHDLSSEIQLFTEDLLKLLLKKNLRQYEGIRGLISVAKLSPYQVNIFLNPGTTSFRGDFIGFYQAMKTEIEIIKIPEEIFFSTKTAIFRGDFLGFLEALSSTKVLTNPVKIFYNSQPERLFHLLSLTEQFQLPPKEIFFKRRSYGPP